MTTVSLQIPQMYKVSQSTKKMQVWLAYTDGAEVIVEYGEVGGKIQDSRFIAEPKNTGKANETTAEDQALKEVEALYVAQEKNKHYRPSQAEAVLAAKNCNVPMHLHNYKNHPAKIIFPTWMQRKMDGSRACILETKMYSKIGLEEEIQIARIREALDFIGHLGEPVGRNIDAEAYIHGKSLQAIRSAWTKVNEDSDLIKLYVFEMPFEEITFEGRMELMHELEELIKGFAPQYADLFAFEYPVLVKSKEEALAFHLQAIEDGYEGVVYTNQGSFYEFGIKTYQKQKGKMRHDAEAFCYGIENCKNGDGKLLLRASDNLNNVEFKGMMKVKRRDGGSYPRDYESMKEECLGKWVNFSYEDISEVKEKKKGVFTGGKPTKPVVEGLRDCDTSGSPLV